VLSIGFSLSFGAMFSKTWRVHKIFTAAKTLKKMAIKDLHLLVIVAGLLAVDVVFLSCWIAIDPLEAEILTFKEMIRKEQDIIIIPALYQCTCQYKTYFLGVLFAYKGILLLFGLFLAWETRNVTIPALNDSRYIGMSVYNVVVLSIIGAIVAIALDGSMYYEAPYAISSLCLIVCTTATLLLVFVPKIYQFLMKDETLTTQASSMHVGQTRTRAHSHSLNGSSPVLKERHTSFTCKSTQTDCDVPGSAGASTLLIPLIERQGKNNGQDLNVVSNSCSHQFLLCVRHFAYKGYSLQLSEIVWSKKPTTMHNCDWSLSTINSPLRSFLFLTKAMPVWFVSLFFLR